MSGPPAELVFQELPIDVFGRADHCAGCSRVESLVGAAVAPGTPWPRFDIATTRDGGLLASRAFRDVCAHVPGIEFVPLDGAHDLALAEVDRIVRIDPFESHVKSGPTCSRCGHPRYTVRSGPIRLEEGERIPIGFSRTDLTFGDTADFGPSQPVRLRPNILVDRETARQLKSAPLLGIHLITLP